MKWFGLGKSKDPSDATPKCPECGGRMWRVGSPVVNRDGLRKQNFRCSKCRRVTKNPVY